MGEKVVAYILSLFLLSLDVPALVWILSPSKNGEEEAIKIVCVVFVGGLVNLVGGFAAWRQLKTAVDQWGKIDFFLNRFFQICMGWMAWTFGIAYIKQVLIPL